MASPEAQSQSSTLESTSAVETPDITAGTQTSDPPSLRSQPVPASVKKSGPTTIEDLPNELLANIIAHLDLPAPSTSHAALHDEPTLEITHSKNTYLKSFSGVTKLWRQMAIPLLFKHPRYILNYTQEEDKPILNDLIGPFLKFAQEHQLAKIITTFTLVVREKKISNCPDNRKRTGEFDSFWRALFRVIDPTTVLIAAPAEALGALTSTRIHTSDDWTFNCPCHYLRLQRKARPTDTLTVKPEPREEDSFINTLPRGLFPENLSEVGHVHSSSPASPGTEVFTFQSQFEERAEMLEETRYAIEAEIFDLKPWTSLLLNEGSSLRAYATWQWWERRPPSILHNLVGDEEITALIRPGIKDFEYICIFPMASHFSKLSSALPRLDRLYIQLVPRNGILENKTQMKGIEPEDLWMERNNCYALLMRELFSQPPEGNYRHLKIFESGDAADKDAWAMAVEFVKRAGPEWRVESDGVFVKDAKKRAADQEGDDDSSSSPLSVSWSIDPMGMEWDGEPPGVFAFIVSNLSSLPDILMRSICMFVSFALDIFLGTADHGPQHYAQDTGNKVSRKSQIIGTTNIILGGKTVIQAEVIIRGDLLRTLPPTNAGEKQANPVAVAIGRGCELRPPGKIYRGGGRRRRGGGVLCLLLSSPSIHVTHTKPNQTPSLSTQQSLTTPFRTFSHFPLKIGDHVFVGANSIIEAAILGNHIHIGANVVIGKFTIVKDFVKILDGTVVPQGMVIPSFSVVGGRPGRVVGEVAEGEVEGMDLREVYRGIKN
ncbi:F-box domain-containing protein [Rutstroemia sp. NJR-2017a BBW]|nr:F-box domain-containing protein [Rutstroemia sp. NJR-2017a BBW]